jgi:membrane dipeptidase
MRTRLFILAILLACPAFAGDLEKKAQQLNQKAFVFDAHCDTVMRIFDQGVDIGKRSKEGHIDIPRMKEGGLNAVVFTMWIEPDFWPHRAAFRTLQYADTLVRTIGAHPKKLGLALSAKDARRLVEEGKVAVFLGIEGGHAIEDSLATLRMFHRLGVRVMTLTWWENTNWAGGSGGTPKNRGLTEFGKKVVQEMNRLGMVIDVSHASDKTFLRQNLLRRLEGDHQTGHCLPLLRPGHMRSPPQPVRQNVKGPGQERGSDRHQLLPGFPGSRGQP